ncbi:MAG TPA: ABC transporter permease [Vicinamibacterales bacterium]|nr:ABC transporter permease [Vicinamibacterales bacterium]
MRKALAVGKKEFRQIGRDRRTLAILLLVPVAFLLLFGYALNFDVRDVPLAVQDRDNSAESRALVSAFLNSGYFSLEAAVRDPDELNRLVDEDRVTLFLVIPENTGRALRRGDVAPVQVILNGVDSTTGATVLTYSLAIVRSVSSQILIEQGWPGAANPPPVTVEPRIWYNPELRSALFLVPGLIGFIGMITAAVSTALSVVREKERGTWEQVRMAPIDTLSYIMGKTLPYLGLSLASSMAIILAAMWLFDLPMRGSWLLLLLATTLFLLASLGIGLLVSTIAESQLVAFQIVLILAFLPTFLLSGFVFPIQNMPVVIQAVTFVVPARYFLVALRGVVLKGVGIEAFWIQLVALAVFASVVLGLAAARLARERG